LLGYPCSKIPLTEDFENEDEENIVLCQELLAHLQSLLPEGKIHRGFVIILAHATLITILSSNQNIKPLEVWAVEFKVRVD